jgi:hypothetical protein
VTNLHANSNVPRQNMSLVVVVVLHCGLIGLTPCNLVGITNFPEEHTASIWARRIVVG